MAGVTTSDTDPSAPSPAGSEERAAATFFWNCATAAWRDRIPRLCAAPPGSSEGVRMRRLAATRLCCRDRAARAAWRPRVIWAWLLRGVPRMGPPRLAHRVEEHLENLAHAADVAGGCRIRRLALAERDQLLVRGHPRGL